MFGNITYKRFWQAITGTVGSVLHCGAFVSLQTVLLPGISIVEHAGIYKVGTVKFRRLQGISLPVIPLTRKLALLGKNNFERFGCSGVFRIHPEWL